MEKNWCVVEGGVFAYAQKTGMREHSFLRCCCCSTEICVHNLLHKSFCTNFSRGNTMNPPERLAQILLRKVLENPNPQRLAVY